jgi:hypothetical protein
MIAMTAAVALRVSLGSAMTATAPAVCVSLGVVRFTSMEVRRIHTPVWISTLARVGHGSAISPTRVKVTIDVSVEVGGAMEPASGSDEDAAVEPLRAIVAIGGAAIGSEIIVAIRADGRSADADTDLSLSRGSGRGGSESGHSGNDCKCNALQSVHVFFLTPIRAQARGKKL